jgi:hypothetical protein
MVREQIEFRAGTRQAGNQFTSVSTCKCATCKRPKTNINPARPRCAHGSARNRAVLHGRALSVCCSTVPNGIITLGCSVALGLSRGKVLRFRGQLPGDLCGRTVCGRTPVAAPATATSMQHCSDGLDSSLSHLWASARLSPIVFLTPAQIVIGHRSHGYWTSVQSIDRMRWRNVYPPAGLPVSSASARGSPARGALPPTPPPGCASRLSFIVAGHPLKRVLDIGPQSNRSLAHRLRSVRQVLLQRAGVD